MVGTPETTFPAQHALVGTSPHLRSAIARALKVAPTRWPVLLTGESGTGKELFARLIHEAGPCPQGPFVTVNCGTLPRELAESELFGHERGAFTGALQRRRGWFEEAAGGTLVLDEIGELPLDLQPKLLRVLETQRFRRVGGQGELPCEVRVVASTLRHLGPPRAAPRSAGGPSESGRDGDLGHGRLRLDLYHRLEGMLIALPPLRERREDLPALVALFGRQLGFHLTLEEEALALLQTCAWPGNVRQLRNVVRRAVLFGAAATEPSSDGSRRAWHLTVAALREAMALPLVVGSTSEISGEAPLRPAEVVFTLAEGPSEGASHVLDLRDRSFAEIERAVMVYALARHAGSCRRAARSLGIPKSTFNDRVKRHGLGRG